MYKKLILENTSEFKRISISTTPFPVSVRAVGSLNSLPGSLLHVLVAAPGSALNAPFFIRSAVDRMKRLHENTKLNWKQPRASQWRTLPRVFEKPKGAMARGPFLEGVPPLSHFLVPKVRGEPPGYGRYSRLSKGGTQ